MPKSSARSSPCSSRFGVKSGRGSRRRRGAPSSGAGAGSKSLLCYFRAVGEAQRLPPDEQLRVAREAFEDGQDLTVAVEEEFALLDPATLGLVNRFEDVFAAAQGSDLEGHVVGE